VTSDPHVNHVVSVTVTLVLPFAQLHTSMGLDQLDTLLGPLPDLSPDPPDSLLESLPEVMCERSRLGRKRALSYS